MSLKFSWVYLLTLLLCIDPAVAQERYALIIGNSDYQTSPLKNPENDARLMGETLREAGFKLIGDEAHTNLTREQMLEQILAFNKILRHSKAVGLFYFAGHGVQIEGENYLVPINAPLDDAEVSRIYSVSLGEVLKGMESAHNEMNLIILDACRNNPFKGRSRSLTRGLKLVSAPSGTLIWYATRPGEVAADGDGEHGPFTQALTNSIKVSGRNADEVLRATINEVESQTNRAQTPWQEGFLREEFYFTPPKAVQPPPAPPVATPSAVASTMPSPTATSAPEVKRAQSPAVTLRRGQSTSAPSQLMPVLTIGLGLAALGYGAYANSQNLTAQDEADRDILDEADRDILDETHDQSLIGYVSGGLMVASGIVWYLMRDSAPTATSSFSLSPRDHGGLDFAFSGTW